MPSMRLGPRYSVHDRPAGWRLLLRRQCSLIKPAAWVIFAVLVVGLVVVAGHAAPGVGSAGILSGVRERIGRVAVASGLQVANVVIEGRANTPEALLRAKIGISKGDPILGFSLEEARARIETLPSVEHATVERRLPGTVVISLQERRPIAIWQSQGKYVLVDRSGQVVSNLDIAQFKNLPLIVGQGAPAAAAELLGALSNRPVLAEKVLASVRIGERRWNLRMVSGSDVMLPEGHEAAALDRLLQLQQDHAVLDRPLEAIDLRLPDRLVLRPKPGANDVDVTPPLPPAVLPPARPQSVGSLPPTVSVVAKKSN